ncbi:MAG: bifunctional proline dehydrogenase/L-glutamate gamma-semialdehyde dehydrogenase [Planctomycetota bacterium]|nr:bifunctional proline dehydrogenase/L-glutamate gamma-semialdehyde dehydrogenase [Planctomycetota bacterium]
MSKPSVRDLDRLSKPSVELAAQILAASRKRETRQERSQSGLMARMMDDVPGKKFTIAMADQVLRIKLPWRAADRMDTLIGHYGVPRYFGFLDRLGMWAGNQLARLFPASVMPLVKSKVRSESSNVIIPAEVAPFGRYVEEKNRQQIRINFNQLGEAVLGDAEAERRLQAYLDRLQGDQIDYASVKLSSIVSQVSLTGYEETVAAMSHELRKIYRAAIKSGDGPEGGEAKFVNLDMEEYRDLHLTVDVFQRVLQEPEFQTLEAGIVLQAYLPDSYRVLETLTEWAKARYQEKGAGIKVRLVKGANLAMEQVEASLRDWEQAPYRTKADVDANYKRMLEFATRPENVEAVRVGVASHNLFDVALAMLLRSERGVEKRVEFEMLEGMANAQALEVRERTGGMVVYTPVCLNKDFESAVAYLVRRLDENTAPGSFLGDLFALEEGSEAWVQQSEAFQQACQRAGSDGLASTPNRTQNRLTEKSTPESADQPFRNAADTDFSLPANRAWCEQIYQKWREETVEPVPIQFGGQEVTEGRLTGAGTDPSRPGYAAYRFAQGTVEDLEVALRTAVEGQRQWASLGSERHAEVLRCAAARFAECRGDTIGAMMLDAGKSAVEADVEISEAIDFANYYSHSLHQEGWFDGTDMKPCGVVVVTPPWNFPYAIPAGGVLAALAAGNSVILKPARLSVLTAWQLATQLWAAGVPKEALQFLPLVDGATGKRLVTDSRVNAVILTGSYHTAAMFQEWRPDLRLYAETSGKNSMIITVAADLDLAIKDLVQGAFGHAGQKCSATSLALVQKEVYDDPHFMAQLKDAAESLVVGGSWNRSAVVTPVIQPPDKYLDQGLHQLDSGEDWLLKPEMVDNNPCLWRPGIRVGVKPGSWYHKNECFGPVLGLIRVDDLDQAIEIQNSSDFGLTGGLHSLDPKEIAKWRERVEVGNAYINRGTTGAIVQRQPFGGWKDSCVGPGPKAGGPNYVSALADWHETGAPQCRAELDEKLQKAVERLMQLDLSPEERDGLAAAAGSYAYWWQREFSVEHDPSQVHGESNCFRYLPRPWHMLRVEDARQAGSTMEVARTVLACLVTGTELRVSFKQLDASVLEILQTGGANCQQESAEQLADRLAKMQAGTLRFLGTHDVQLFSPSRIGNIPILSSGVLANGRIELLSHLREQSISQTVHRYGNIV